MSLFSRDPDGPAHPLDVQRRVFEAAEDLLAALPPGAARAHRRVRVVVRAPSAADRSALTVWFEEGDVTPAWEHHLEGAGLGAFARTHLAVEVLGPGDAPDDPAVAADLDRRGIAVVAEGGPRTAARLALRVEDPAALVQSAPEVVVGPDRPVHIGRLKVVTDTTGRVVQTNDLAFRAEHRAISRRQAWVGYDVAEGRYVLHEGPHRGRTQVLRGGQPVDIAGVPTPLRDGDVLRLPGGLLVRCAER